MSNVEPKLMSSVDEVIHQIHYFDAAKGTHIFRGQADCDWKLLPSLFRHYPKSKYSKEKAILYEQSLCATLVLNERMPYLNTFDPIELLMTLQHFEIPTRLLDCTSDILVSLFFACYDPQNKCSDKNGRIFLLESFHQKGAYPRYRINCPEAEVLKNGINDDNVEYFKSRVDQNPEISILEPFVKNPRMRIQDGCFLFFPFGNLEEDEEDYFDLVKFNRAKNTYNKEQKIRDESIFLVHIDIKSCCKKDILKELDSKHGISERSLFVELNDVEEAKSFYNKLAFCAEKKSEELLNAIHNKK